MRLTKKICRAKGCDKIAVSLGACRGHYSRLCLGKPNALDTPLRVFNEHALCSIPGCIYPSHAHGYCNAHARRYNANGLVGIDAPMTRSKNHVPTLCCIPKCEKFARANKMCGGHYTRAKKGMPMPSPLPKPYYGCKIPKCVNPHCCQGYCLSHYRRLTGAVDLPLTAPLGTQKKRKIGDKVKNTNGYMEVKIINTEGNTAWVVEHRLVMEKHLGRPLNSKEEVHHRNAVRHDNRLENLQLWSTSHPAGGRVVDLISHYLDELTKYIPELEKHTADNTGIASKLHLFIGSLNK